MGQHGDIASPGGNLGQIPYFRPSGPGHAAAIGVLETREQAQQGGLAAAVTPDERDLLRALHAEGHAAEDGGRPVGLGEVRTREDGHTASLYRKESAEVHPGGFSFLWCFSDYVRPKISVKMSSPG